MAYLCEALIGVMASLAALEVHHAWGVIMSRSILPWAFVLPSEQGGFCQLSQLSPPLFCPLPPVC